MMFWLLITDDVAHISHEMNNCVLYLNCSAIVTLKHGVEAESVVAELYGVPLLGSPVQISLYRSDNLLCVGSLPPALCTDDAAFRTFAETFGPIEKSFLMRYDDGLLHSGSHLVYMLKNYVR